MNKQIFFFIGTAVELIKISPIIKELKARGIRFKLIVSGQNEVPFEVISNYTGKLKVYYSFTQKNRESSLLFFLLWGLSAFWEGLTFFNSETKKVDRNNLYLILHGDTVTSLIGALVGFILRLKVAHVESGLRSFNFFEPFPEEICRFIVSKIASIHFCPNTWAIKNIRKTNGMKFNTNQNTLIESFLWAVKSPSKLPVKVKGKYFVLVVHRQEHVIFGKQKTVEILNHIFEIIPRGISCIFLIHRLTENLFNAGLDARKLRKQGIIFMPRTSFVNFVRLLKKSEFIITDGGTNQEEAYYLGKPCLILRNVTERVEGLGKNALIASEDKFIINDFIVNYDKYKTKEIPLKARPSKLIVDYLINR